MRSRAQISAFPHRYLLRRDLSRWSPGVCGGIRGGWPPGVCGGIRGGWPPGVCGGVRGGWPPGPCRGVSVIFCGEEPHDTFAIIHLCPNRSPSRA